MANWKSLTGQKQEEIRKAIRECYAASVNGNTNLEYRVIMDDAGEIRQSSDFANSVTMDTWKGKEVILYSNRGWKLDVDYREYLDAARSEAAEVVQRFSADPGYYPVGNIADISPADLVEFLVEKMPELYTEINEDATEYEVNEFAGETLDEIWQNICREYEEE
jgi:hypothetical protein